MTGLDKITSQIQEEAEASAKERIEAAQKETDPCRCQSSM